MKLRALPSLLCAIILLCCMPANAESKRQKVIDFDDEVVEGMNKKPLDSLSQLSERDRKRKKLHLYRKRAGFKTETAESLKALRYTQ